MLKLYLKLPYFIKFLLNKIGIGKSSFKKIQNLDLKIDNRDTDKIILFTDLLKKIPKEGVIVECGVATGFTLLILCKISRKKKIYAFDSFEGFPQETSSNDQEKLFEVLKLQKWNYKFMTIDLVKKNLINNNISKEEVDQNVVFKKGFFPDSFEGFNEEISFLHLDVDLYKSYKDCLEFFFTKLKKGGIVTFDEYDEDKLRFKKESSHKWLGAKVAIDEFVEKNNLELLEHFTGYKYIVKS